MNIVIPDDYQDAVRHLRCFSKLEGHDARIFNDSVRDVDALADRFRTADALVLIRERTQITDALLARLPRLKLIAQTGKGTAHIDTKACEKRNVAVRTGTGSPYAPAELAWALIMAATRRVCPESARLKAGAWQGDLGTTLRGRTLGIYGFGKIGRLVASFGRAFGMHVVAWGREGSVDRARGAGHATARDKEHLFESSDVLSVHLRFTPETRGIVSAADLARMKPDSLFVNTSRAELVERDALVTALRNGRPGFAAVDVYEQEPILGASHPLLQLPNALCTPHLGYVEKDSYELYFGEAFDAVSEFARSHGE